jgi:hypothetical protein
LNVSSSCLDIGIGAAISAKLFAEQAGTGCVICCGSTRGPDGLIQLQEEAVALLGAHARRLFGDRAEQSADLAGRVADGL